MINTYVEISSIGKKHVEIVTKTTRTNLVIIFLH